jgi:hypothetical protein
MNLEHRKEIIYQTHNGLKRGFDETTIDEMIEQLNISSEAFNNFLDLSFNKLFRKSRGKKIGNIGACISSLKAELCDIKYELEHDKD